MSTYVMADIHGCYDEFMQMLRDIRFGSEDRLVCAGDYFDRGPKEYEMLNWMMHAPDNVILLQGNHEADFVADVDLMKSVSEKEKMGGQNIRDLRALYRASREYAKLTGYDCFDDCGTIRKLIWEELIPFSKMCGWADRMRVMPYLYRTAVNGRTCIIVHAGYVESLDGVETEKTYRGIEDFYLHARDDAYMVGGIAHGMIVAGHTPTTADEEFPYNDGNVYRMYDEELDCIFYDIDCGCWLSTVRGHGKLACLRLEDEKIFYVKNSDVKGNKPIYLDGMMGLVVGDALGVPVEFSGRRELLENPVTDMMGYGTHPVPAGAWSDDSSMALACLLAMHEEGINLTKVMNNFVAWERQGEFTPLGQMFDEGNTCGTAIRNYGKSHDVSTCGLTGADSNGNGSLMRILPACIYVLYLQRESGLEEEDAIDIVHKMSALTHAHLRSKIACGIYFFCVKELAKRNAPAEQLLQTALDEAFSFYRERYAGIEDNPERVEKELTFFYRIRNTKELKAIPELQILSGGYVIESIEAALWCMLNTESYEECVLKAVNFGHDTDTTAAIAGGLAGVYYGYEGIPVRWKNTVIRREWIEEMCQSM